MSSDCYVVFCDDSKHWWSPILHPTIRHCYVIKPENGKWIVHSKTTKGVEMYTTDDVTDVVENDIIVKAVIREPRRGLFMLNTCVGHTKQVLGITKPFIWTPYQLYRYLKHESTEST